MNDALIYLIPAMGIVGLIVMAIKSAWVSKQDAGDSNVRDAVSTEMVSHRRPGWPKSHVANNRDARRTRRATPPIPSGPLWLDKTSAARLSPDATCSDHSSRNHSMPMPRRLVTDQSVQFFRRCLPISVTSFFGDGRQLPESGLGQFSSGVQFRQSQIGTFQQLWLLAGHGGVQRFGYFSPLFALDQRGTAAAQADEQQEATPRRSDRAEAVGSLVDHRAA